MNQIKVALAAITILHASCRNEASLKIHSTAPAAEENGGFSLPPEHREMFKLRYNRGFELENTRITSKEIAGKRFQEYYVKLYDQYGGTGKGITKIWCSSGYYYARVRGESWYIFAKHGDAEVHDGGYMP